MQRLRHFSSHQSFVYLWVVGALLVLGALGYSYIASHPSGVFDGQHEGDVRTTVAGFGNAFSAVSLDAPDAAIQIRTAYGPYVAPELLATWEENPSLAPGRSASGAWPDHIVVESVVQVADDAYEVTGRIVYAAADAPDDATVTLTVTRINGSYLVTHFGTQQNVPLPSSLESIATSLDQPQSALGVEITPKKLIADTRCDSARECSDEGTVQVRATIGYGVGLPTEAVFILGVANTFDAYLVTLADVLPVPSSKTPEPHEYVFIFRVETR